MKIRIVNNLHILCVCVCVHAHECVCVCVCVHAHECVCVCVFVIVISSQMAVTTTLVITDHAPRHCTRSEYSRRSNRSEYSRRSLDYDNLRYTPLQKYFHRN